MNSLKVNCVLITTILLWASAFVGIKVGLVGYSPGSLALLRFMVASLCMALIYHNQPEKKFMPWNDRIQLLLAGMVGIGVYNICLNYGEITLSAGIASFVIGLMPVITVFMCMIFFRERLNSGVWAGIAVSLAGLVMLAWGEGADASMRQGVVLVFLSAVSGSALTLIQKRFLIVYNPVTIMAWVMWGGTLLLLIFWKELWHELRQADYQSTGAGVFLGIFPAAIAYLAWTYVLKHLSASKASMSLNAMPLVSTLLGFFYLHEMPSLNSLVGGSIALIGAFIAHRFYEESGFDSSVDDELAAM